MRRPGLAIAIAGGLAALGATAVASYRGPGHAAPIWRETGWTAPIDNWGQGKAWRSDTGVMLFARTKTGFCNCFSGVGNDIEIDRIGDVDLHGDAFVPASPGVVAALGDLSGRKRRFHLQSRWTGGREVLSIVVATDCKAVVATLVSGQPIASDIEESAVALLRGAPFRQWADGQQ